MGALSNYYGERTLNALCSGQPFTPPSSLWVALYETDPEPANTGVEVSGDGYARVKIAAMTFAGLVGGKMTASNSSIIEFPKATGAWSAAAYWAVLDAQTGGNLICKEALATARTFQEGDIPRFEPGDIVITIE